jgi:phage tail sheath protein FI
MNYAASFSQRLLLHRRHESGYDTIEDKVSRSITPKNSYGAVYVPWVRMLDPTGRSAEPILVPPSGFVAGLYARTDGRVGVWKAPAGTSVALGGGVGLAVQFTDVQQGNLNPINVNVIRQFAALESSCGGRTITSDPSDYIPCGAWLFSAGEYLSRHPVGGRAER